MFLLSVILEKLKLNVLQTPVVSSLMKNIFATVLVL